MSALLAQLLRAPRIPVSCSCGWRDGSATRPGAVLLAAEHHRRHGLRGHVIELDGHR